MLQRYIQSDPDWDFNAARPIQPDGDELGVMSLTSTGSPPLNAADELGCQGLVNAESDDEHELVWLALLRR